MIRTRFGAACLMVVLLATGCTSVIGGTAQRAPNSKQGSLSGQTIKQALLDGAALSNRLNQPFQTVPPFPPHFGGSEELEDRSGSPAGCVGVVFMLQQSAYKSAEIANIATEGWAHGGHSVKVDEVVEGVVSLHSASDAAALFARFSAQWKQCDGTTLTVPSDIFTQDSITDLRVTNSVLAATISREPGEHPILNSIREARAIGVQGNCLGEVDVAFIPVAYPSDEGSGDINTSAIDIAHAMMDKISALS